MGLGRYVVDAVVLEGRSPTRQIPPPAQSPESGDDRSPHSVSGSNCNHGVEGGHHGEICSALTRKDKKESMSAQETPLAKTPTSGTDGLPD